MLYFPPSTVESRISFNGRAEATPDRQLLLTKGDNNDVDDIALYAGLEWLERRHVIGKVRG
jgi:signal peptidase